MSNKKPLYATIPYLGNQYSVTFEAEVAKDYIITSSLTGYGSIPKQYQDIPTIVFKKNEKVFDWMKLNLSPIEADPDFGNCTLQEYLQKAKEIGITVLNLD